MMQQVDVNLKKNAWALRAEGAVDPQLRNQSLAGEGGPKKSRNRRKKKNSHNDFGPATSKAEADWDIPVLDNSERVHVGASGWECFDRDQLSMRPNLVQHSGVATAFTNDIHVSNQCLKKEEGWELTGNRKSRRNEVAPRNQCGRPYQATGWSRGGHSANKLGSASIPAHCWDRDGAHPQALRNSEAAVDRNVKRDGPFGGRHKLKPHGSQNGGEEKCDKGKSSDGGIKGTKSLDNELSGKWSWEGQQSGWRNPVDLAEAVPVVKGPDATGAWNRHGILPHSVGAWQQKSTIGDFKSALGNMAWGSNIEKSQMLSNFSLSEKQGKAGSDENSNYKPVHSYGSVVPDEFPSSLHSESICSNDDLDDDSDWVDSEGFNSDASKVSHETRKKDRRLRQFFDTLAALSMDQLNEHDRQWHCPACQGVVGAIDWYRGLQPLLAHANSVRCKKVKLHRNFAKVLEEEIRRRGMSWGHPEEVFGKWKGLREDSENVNPFIVWPPTIIIQNTRLELDEQDKVMTQQFELELKLIWLPTESSGNMCAFIIKYDFLLLLAW